MKVYSQNSCQLTIWQIFTKYPISELTNKESTIPNIG